LRPKRIKTFCRDGAHVFVAWTLEGVATPVRKCIKEGCDYEQSRSEYFFRRKKIIDKLAPGLKIVKKYGHIDLFI
jgi:hypothetical protein